MCVVGKWSPTLLRPNTVSTVYLQPEVFLFHLVVWRVISSDPGVELPLDKTTTSLQRHWVSGISLLSLDSGGPRGEKPYEHNHLNVKM